jgi:hypothetical protein
MGANDAPDPAFAIPVLTHLNGICGNVLRRV